MINAAWLLLFIPLSACIGFVVAGIIFGQEADPDDPKSY
jgi:hypothetical protein